MSEEIYQSKFATINVEFTSSFLSLIWTDEQDNLQENTYKDEVLNYKTFLEKYQPKFILDDARRFLMPIPPDIQEWVAKTITETLNQYVEKYAMVMPVEFIANLSADQNIDEVQGSVSKTIFQQFASIEEAMDWMGI